MLSFLNSFRREESWMMENGLDFVNCEQYIVVRRPTKRVIVERK